MSRKREDQEGPCLHCMMVELIDDFFAGNPATAGKTVAELTSQQDGVVRQQVIEELMRQIMHYDDEFRREDAAGAIASHARH